MLHAIEAGGLNDRVTGAFQAAGNPAAHDSARTAEWIARALLVLFAAVLAWRTWGHCRSWAGVPYVAAHYLTDHL